MGVQLPRGSDHLAPTDARVRPLAALVGNNITFTFTGRVRQSARYGKHDAEHRRRRVLRVDADADAERRVASVALQLLSACNGGKCQRADADIEDH